MAAANGITPAYAGKSFSMPTAVDAMEDHPRLRGEKGRFFLRVCERGGSPPLTRGKVMAGMGASSFCGITPAYAGKSEANPPSIHRQQDHPRLRGEKLLLPFDSM